MSDWDKFVGPVCDAFDQIRELPQPDRRRRLWWIAKEALYHLGVGDGFVVENGVEVPTDPNEGRATTDLLCTKERLVYHLLRLVEATFEGEFGDEPHRANELLLELGYFEGRRAFMLENGEPGLGAQWTCECGHKNMGGAACVSCHAYRR